MIFSSFLSSANFYHIFILILTFSGRKKKPLPLKAEGAFFFWLEMVKTG